MRGQRWENEGAQTLREIDESTIKLLDDRKANLHYIHVRSHRRCMVEWNDLADRLAGEVWDGLPGAVPKAPEMKCKADCQPASPCSACVWNQKVNAFLQDLHPIPVSLPLWQQTSSSRHSSTPRFTHISVSIIRPSFIIVIETAQRAKKGEKQKRYEEGHEQRR